MISLRSCRLPLLWFNCCSPCVAKQPAFRMGELRGPQPGGMWETSPLMQTVRWARKTSPNLIKMLWELESSSWDKVKGSRVCAFSSVYAARDHQGNKIQAAFPRQWVTPSSAESRVFTFGEIREGVFVNKKLPHFQFILSSPEWNLIHLCSFPVALQTICLWIIFATSNNMVHQGGLCLWT